MTAAQRSVSLSLATTRSMHNPQLTTMPFYKSRLYHCLRTDTWGLDGAVCWDVKPYSLVITAYAHSLLSNYSKS